MSTGSTKRARKKARAQGQRRQSEKGAANTPEREVSQAWADAPAMSERTWTYLALAVVVAAALLRLVMLELKPMHHDEGVNGFFLTNLLRQGVYRYDPANYHGPSLYYLTLPAVALLGLNTFAVRLVTALFGVATVALVLYLRRYIGMVGALAAAALVAFSPGAVYYSRYFIHETLFVFFTVATVVAALRFYDEPSQANPRLWGGLLSAAGGGALVVVSLVAALSPELFDSHRWLFITLIVLLLCCVFVALTSYDGPRGFYLMLAAGAAALMFATKETAFISAGVLVLATLIALLPTLIAWVHDLINGRVKFLAAKNTEEGWQIVLKVFRVLLLISVALAFFLFVNVLLYSSFFTNAKGVTDALETFKVWTKTGQSDFHRKGFITYALWLRDEELPTLILASLGSMVALVAAFFARHRNRFAVFAGAWAFGTALAYSLIPYKTPWLMLSFTVPMAIVGGYAVQFIYGGPRRDAVTRSLAVIGLGFALAACLWQTVVLNFREYDNDKYPYVYAHTRREFEDLVREVERLSERAGTREKTGIAIATPDYWPMPWYLNRHTSGVAYDQRVLTRYDPQTTPVVIGRENQIEQLRAALGPDYKQVGGEYALRPGVNLVLFARTDIAGP